MSRFGNKRRDNFIENLQKEVSEGELDRLVEKSKFSFAYFSGEPPSRDFGECEQDALSKLLNKLKDFSGFPLDHWKQTSIGSSGKVLSIYNTFPKNSDFKHPAHVPQCASWGRFRLEQSLRLVGFVVPQRFADERRPNGHRFDANTFYVVFLDFDHGFYKTKPA